MLHKIARYRLVSILSLASFAFVIGGFAWSYAALSRDGMGPFILHFNDMDGITAVGGVVNLLYMGVVGVVMVVVNFFVALELEARDRTMGKVVAAVTLLFAILLFLAFSAILNVN